MSKYLQIISILAVYILASCQSDDSKEKDPPKPDRNIGGLGLERGLKEKTAAATAGYVFFTTLPSDTTYMINMDGQVVHTWSSDYGPSGWTYLKDNGNLMRGGRDPETPRFDGGGRGGYFEEYNWEGDLVWQYKLSSSENLAHHDIAIMPNGNILAVSWEGKTTEEAIAAGRKPDLIPKAGVWPDMVVEYKPQGDNEAEVVWEWHIWDHMVQDFDANQQNYGVVTDHPELMDINNVDIPEPITQEQLEKRRANNGANPNDTPENQGSDLYHINAINYNVDLDQIVMSSPHLDEVFIIDHSTTTQEAAGHMGGRWGKGGDLLYRWGNPENYDKGDSTDRVLGGQHDVKWIETGLPGEGKLMVFNNNVNVPWGKPGYSAVLEITTPLTESEYELGPDGKYGPSEPSWSYIAKDTVSFFSPFISGAHRMSNGNTFITQGAKGRYFEVTPSGEVVWDYWTPYAGYVRMADGTTPQPVGPNFYATFRATHVPANHPALAGRTLEPLDPQPAIYKVK